MKVQIKSKNQKHTVLKSMLEKGGFEVSEEAKLVLTDNNIIIDSIIGKKDEESSIILIKDIVFIESFGRTIIVHTLEDSFTVKEKLYELEETLDSNTFLRVNKSMIVSRTYIKKIIPSINGRLNLLMMNNMIVSISRSYNKSFKQFLGL